MVHIIVDRISERLGYTINWIFVDQLGMDYKLIPIADIDSIPQNEPIINYSSDKNLGHLYIKPSAILFDSEIVQYPINFHRWKHTSIIFYNQPGAVIPFDIFGAIFFLLSRMEEYYPHKKDKHNRFSAKNSINYLYNFLQEPVVDQWLKQFKLILQQKFNLVFKQKKYKYRSTFDIDIAYCYKYKSPIKNVLGWFKDIMKGQFALAKYRVKVLQNQMQDPYDNFDWLKSIHTNYNIKPVYFWLLANTTNNLDTNLSPQHPAMKSILFNHVDAVSFGIHPSYASNENIDILKSEINNLTQYKSFNKSRQHYIKLNIPQTYHQLLKANIYEDYTMGYPDAHGFRAGTSNSFNWFDLTTNTSTELRIYPFVFMDATSIFYLKESTSKAKNTLERLHKSIKETDGQMITIFHNYTMNNNGLYKGWKELYEWLLKINNTHL